MRLRNLMFFSLCILTLSITGPKAMADQAVDQLSNTLIREIKIEGFVLDNRDQFTKLFKAYRNKQLSGNDLDTILQKVQEYYEQAGYQGLVKIEYHIIKKRLIFSVSLVK